MTDIFIYIILGAIVVYDAIVVIRKGRSITSFFRRWYKTFIFVPFSIGVIFLGHFLDLIQIVEGIGPRAIGLSAAGAIVLLISIILDRTGKELPGRVYALIPIIIGYFVGDIWW